MKSISILIVLVASCFSSAFGQGNCSYITYSRVNDSLKIAPGCDINNNMAVTETQTYTVWCVDETNNNNIYFTTGTSANPNPQITSTGQTNEACSSPRIDCYPDFEPENDNAAFADASDNLNRFYLRVWDRTRSGSQCAKVGFQQNFQQCIAVACPTAGNLGGGGSDPPPGCGGSGGSDLTDGSGGTGCSPILLDIGNEGFHLTSAQAGVLFDIGGTGHPLQVAWTDPHFRNAFLALPGPDGLVHNGKQLFGNFTAQPASAHPNGFLALAQYDKAENGGNEDGVIDEHDTVFSHLRLWIDENHDGICQPNELHPLGELGVSSISLSYHLSRLEDQYGNVFRYRARLNPQSPDDQSEVGKIIYDVFFTTTRQ